MTGPAPDGRTLIPGDPAALHTFASGLSDFAGKLSATGDGLKRVNTRDGWSGGAGEAFRQSFDKHTPQWFTASDAFRDASTAVARYAETLTWAQQRATQAAQDQAQAQVASQAAVTAYNDNAARGAQQPPFIDPGLEAHNRAQTALDDVNAQLQRAGDDAAAAVSNATALAPAEPFWARVGSGIVQAAGEVGALGSAVGQTLMENPGTVTAAAAGAGATVAGVGGVLGGGAVSLSGVGATVGVPAVAASGALALGGLATIGAATMDMARKAGDNYSRPSGFRKGVRDTVFDKGKGPDGKVRDPATGKEIKPKDKWDMGHKPGQEFRKHQDEARARGDTRKEFLDDHNNPGKYRPETPNTNRSHKLEDKSDKYGSD